MKKAFSLIAILLIAGTSALHAQWKRGATVLKNTPRTARAVTRITNLAEQRIARQTVQQIARQSVRNEQQHVAHLKKATVTIELPKDDFSTTSWVDPKASAFVIEDNSNGETQLWGVSASHYLFSHPLWEDPLTHDLIPLDFVAQGSFGFNDVTLFPLPKQMREQIEPLQLAQGPVQLGDNLHSVGYFDDAFQVEKNRLVKEVSPHRIITRLKVEDKLSREGACGGPVLNEAGEVVGMHVGSSEPRKIGFVIPAEHIREALYAYHHQGKALHSLVFQGRALGSININEYVQSLEVWKNNRVVETFLTYHNRLGVDYDHLENLVNTEGADKLMLHIEQNPFSTLDENQKIYRYTITYDLHSHAIERQEGW